MVTAAAWKPFRAGMMMKETMVSRSLKESVFRSRVDQRILKTTSDDDGAEVRVERRLLTYATVVIRGLDFRHVEVMPIFHFSLVASSSDLSGGHNVLLRLLEL